jgi:two-component system, OmpR family, phosphate regulon sensor histidine kinase PhoR
VKNSTIRIIVILGALCIAGITVTQIYWVKRAFDLKEAEFERTVTTALNNVAHQIFEINKTPAPAVNPVKQISTNYFVVMVNSELDASLLEYLLKMEFEKRNVIVDFEYGVYDCTNQCMLYGDYVPLKTAKDKTTSKKFPTWANQGYHFGVQFPNREAHLINQMGIWSFSSVVLLLVIVFFAYTLFVILKQKRLSEIQKDFINNMTHEFKTPISTIAVSTEVLKNPDIIRYPDRLMNYTAIIEKENLRLKQHVERVLQMARLDKEDIGFRKEQVDIHQIIQDAIHNTSLVLTEKPGTVNVVAEARNSRVPGDKLHLTNVFNNLIENAVKYCKGCAEITVRTINQNNGITVEVKDNGIGITTENQKRIFQKFYRVPTGNVHDVKGFGLGLSYVKTVVEGHGGHVNVQSEIGKGSVFRVFLPLV